MSCVYRLGGDKPYHAIASSEFARLRLREVLHRLRSPFRGKRDRLLLFAAG